MTRVLARLCLAALPVAFAAPALADLVQTVDGKWHGVPKDLPPLGPKDQPGPDYLRQTADAKADATYETVKLKGWSSPAGLVRQIVASDQETVDSFREGMILGGGDDTLDDAVEMLRAAADETAGFAKQQALYYRMMALQGMGDVPQTTAAIDELLSAFPNAFYFADAQIVRARTQAADPAAVEKTLAGVKGAKGMNLRDVYRAEYERVRMTIENQKKWAEAKAAYEALVAQIEKGDAAQGATTLQLARVGIGNALLRTNQPNEAVGLFAKAAAEGTDPDVLARAYLGLGNVAFGVAKQLQDEKKLEEAKDKLTQATEHYLRVTLLYKDALSDFSPVVDAYENQAKAFVALFRQSDGKDCTAAERAYSAYFKLQSLVEGAEKRRIQREGTEFNKERKEKGCK